MGISSALFQNFYMDPAEVFDAGERICSAMAGVNGCLNEAEGVFGQISSLTASVPAQARCGALISACENAISTIRNTDFSAYGSRVSQNMCKLADLSEHVAGATIKVMEDVREILDRICKEVNEEKRLLRIKSKRGEMMQREDLMEIYSRSPVNLNYNINKNSLEYQVIKYAQLQMNKDGLPVINSKVDAERYQKLVHLFKNGGSVDVTNYDGSTTTFYLCDTTFREAVDRQVKCLRTLGDDDKYKSLEDDELRELIRKKVLPYDLMKDDDMYQFLDPDCKPDFDKERIHNLLSEKGELEGMEDAFWEAQEKSGLSYVRLMNLSFLETGHGKNVIKETINGVEVKNVYGFGAFDANPHESGVNTAFKHNWITIELAIVGGAEAIQHEYIEKGQITMYEMRWNPENPGEHQYATDISWVTEQTGMTAISALYNEMPREELHFRIPVYPLEPEEMPQE